MRELARGIGGTTRVLLVSPDTDEALSKHNLTDSLAAHLCLPTSLHSNQTCRDLSDWLLEHQVDIAHFHFTGSFAWKSGKMDGGVVPKIAKSGIHCIVTNHQAVTPFDHSRRGEPLLRRIVSHTLRMPGKTRQLRATFREILVSRHDLELSKRWFPHVAGHFGMIYHSQLDGNAPVAELPESREILNLASIAFRKGQHILADAFARVAGDFPEWRLRLVGMHLQKECLDAVKQIAANHGLQERILLPGPDDAPQQVIANAEIYVQPSLLEGLGLSLQEAQFQKRPCIGTHVGGIPELITDGQSGLLVPPADPAAMAKALARLMNDRVLRENLGCNARKTVIQKGMTRQAMLAAHWKLYDECNLTA